MEGDNDVSLPRATLSKMIKDYVPQDVRVANDTIDLLIECCTEFIQLVSSEANEVATKEQKHTIQPEHVVKALQELGFEEFVAEVSSTWEQFKQDLKSSSKINLRKTIADQAGLTEEQQIALQQQMFAAARARSLNPEPGCTTAVAAMAAAYGSGAYYPPAAYGAYGASSSVPQQPPYPQPEP